MTLAKTLIVCGTTCVVAAVAVLAYSMHLSAEDARDHRQQTVSLLGQPGVQNVILSRWEPPNTALAWCSLLGGFGMAAVGIRVGSRAPDAEKLASVREM
jgi:hypothetical protein